MKKQVFIDLEANSYTGEIISIGAVYGNESFYSLINIDNPLPRRLQDITGITNDMLEMAPFCSEVMGDFLQWLPESPIIYHFGTSDKGWMTKAKSSSGVDISVVLDNMVNCQRLLSRMSCGKKVLSLLNISKAFGLQERQTHNALDDAIMLSNIFNFLSSLNDREFLELLYENVHKNGIFDGSIEKFYKNDNWVNIARCAYDMVHQKSIDLKLFSNIS